MPPAAIDLVAIAGNTGGFVIHGQDGGDRSGRSVAFAGDINGDGFDDLVVCAPSADGVANAKAYAGDDTIEISDLGFARAMGGSGTDTLVLALGGDAPAATALGDYFEVFRRNYVASKPHMVLRED
jgi:hypothetical protein